MKGARDKIKDLLKKNEWLFLGAVHHDVYEISQTKLFKHNGQEKP